MLLFDIGKVCRKHIHPKNKYFFASFNNDRGLSLEDKTKDYVEEIPSSIYTKYIRHMRSHNSGNLHGENLHI